ncbi:hypothetical protein PENARI_c002G04446 [Penicillium arizonense]|uniref:Uncharacterized protein n=1 Tax=Penicillium arizonense TaxID=1835702 RepID=A0A1F5LVQ8_PENAI|nr:hypothetical protein PENARI_c002G04446 [Penicillium arizonense]OGE57224.1 hypothetical protein PENARI_c002G04446 [Penicillium arizonense]
MANYYSQRRSPRMNFDNPQSSFDPSRRERALNESNREEPHHYRRDLVPGHRSHDKDKYHGHRHRNDHHHRHRYRDDYHQDNHRHRHIAEGAIVGVGIAEMIHKHRKKEGEEVSHGFGHFAHVVGAGALGAVAVNEASRMRRHNK